MDAWTPDVWTWAWFAGGAVLMALELALPGLVAVFLGAAAIAVGLGRWVGLWPSAMGSLVAWFVLSIVFLVALRSLVARWFPSDATRSPTDEDVAAYGQVVEVLTEVNPTEAQGRIRFQGSSWPAISLQGVIPAGRRVRLLARDNLAWVVEPADDALDEPPKA